MAESSRLWRDRLLPGLTGVTMLVAIWMVFLLVPSERDQGLVQRIFYFHVPLAWMAFAGFAFVAGASVWFLARGSDRADRLAHANAEVGLLYTTLVLVTGPIWAELCTCVPPQSSSENGPPISTTRTWSG